MTDEDLERIRLAREAAKNAYAPYSGFTVGAVAVGASGTLYPAANVENAAFPSSVCAEANAVTTAVAAGERRVVAVYVSCLGAPACTPCGNCRQIMREFGVTRVVLDGPDGPEALDLEELLPRSFGPEALGS